MGGEYMDGVRDDVRASMDGGDRGTSGRAL